MQKEFEAKQSYFKTGCNLDRQPAYQILLVI